MAEVGGVACVRADNRLGAGLEDGIQAMLRRDQRALRRAVKALHTLATQDRTDAIVALLLHARATATATATAASPDRGRGGHLDAHGRVAQDVAGILIKRAVGAHWGELLTYKLNGTSAMGLLQRHCSWPPKRVTADATGRRTVDYLLDTLSEDGKLDYSFSVALIGDSGAGKTSLWKSLHALKPCACDVVDSTNGVEIYRSAATADAGPEWCLVAEGARVPVDVVARDMAGQRVFEVTNTYFMRMRTSLAVHVLCISLSRAEKPAVSRGALRGALRWLQTLAAHVPSFRELRLVVVGTHADDCTLPPDAQRGFMGVVVALARLVALQQLLSEVRAAAAVQDDVLRRRDSSMLVDLPAFAQTFKRAEAMVARAIGLTCDCGEAGRASTCIAWGRLRAMGVQLIADLRGPETKAAMSDSLHALLDMSRTPPFLLGEPVAVGLRARGLGLGLLDRDTKAVLRSLRTRLLRECAACGKEHLSEARLRLRAAVRDASQDRLCQVLPWSEYRRRFLPSCGFATENDLRSATAWLHERCDVYLIRQPRTSQAQEPIVVLDATWLCDAMRCFVNHENSVVEGVRVAAEEERDGVQWYRVSHNRGGRAWHVSHRYNDFKLLSMEVEGRVKKKPQAAFPRAGWFDKEDVEARRAGLEAWLRTVVAEHAPSGFRQLLLFMDIRDAELRELGRVGDGELREALTGKYPESVWSAILDVMVDMGLAIPVDGAAVVAVAAPAEHEHELRGHMMFPVLMPRMPVLAAEQLSQLNSGESERVHVMRMYGVRSGFTSQLLARLYGAVGRGGHVDNAMWRDGARVCTPGARALLRINRAVDRKHDDDAEHGGCGRAQDTDTIEVLVRGAGAGAVRALFSRVYGSVSSTVRDFPGLYLQSLWKVEPGACATMARARHELDLLKLPLDLLDARFDKCHCARCFDGHEYTQDRAGAWSSAGRGWCRFGLRVYAGRVPALGGYRVGFHGTRRALVGPIVEHKALLKPGAALPLALALAKRRVVDVLHVRGATELRILVGSGTVAVADEGFALDGFVRGGCEQVGEGGRTLRLAWKKGACELLIELEAESRIKATQMLTLLEADLAPDAGRQGPWPVLYRAVRTNSTLGDTSSLQVPLPAGHTSEPAWVTPDPRVEGSYVRSETKGTHGGSTRFDAREHVFTSPSVEYAARAGCGVQWGDGSDVQFVLETRQEPASYASSVVLRESVGASEQVLVRHVDLLHGELRILRPEHEHEHGHDGEPEPEPELAEELVAEESFSCDGFVLDQCEQAGEGDTTLRLAWEKAGRKMQIELDAESSTAATRLLTLLGVKLAPGARRRGPWRVRYRGRQFDCGFGNDVLERHTRQEGGGGGGGGGGAIVLSALMVRVGGEGAGRERHAHARPTVRMPEPEPALATPEGGGGGGGEEEGGGEAAPATASAIALQPGDHVFHRFSIAGLADPFTHHAVYCGTSWEYPGGYVVHWTSADRDELLTRKWLGKEFKLPNAEIRRMGWKEFKARAGEYRLLRKAYPGTVLPAFQVVERAERCVGQRGVAFAVVRKEGQGFAGYNPFTWNCAHRGLRAQANKQTPLPQSRASREPLCRAEVWCFDLHCASLSCIVSRVRYYGSHKFPQAPL